MKVGEGREKRRMRRDNGRKDNRVEGREGGTKRGEMEYYVYLRQVNRHVHVVIQEVGILLGIQQLQQSRGRVPLIATPYFVHLVNQDEWVFCLHLLETLDHFAGHRTYIRPTMTFDLSHVCHSSNTKPEILQRKHECTISTSHLASVQVVWHDMTPTLYHTKVT